MGTEKDDASLQARLLASPLVFFGVLCLVAAPFSPRFLLALPVFGCLGLCAGSFFRKEPLRWASVAAAPLAVLLLAIDAMPNMHSAVFPAASSHWNYQLVKDPVTDARRGIATLESNGDALVVKCDSDGPDSIYVDLVSHGYLGGTSDNQNRAVLLRLDGGPVASTEWYYSGDDAIITNSAGRATALQVAAAKSIVARLTDFDGREVTMTFASDGNQSAVKSAFAACGEAWPKT